MTSPHLRPKTPLQSENRTLPQRKSATPPRQYAEIKTYHHPMSQFVDHCDLERLQPGRWLNSHIINYVIWSIANTYVETRLLAPEEICFLPTGVFEEWKSHGKYNPRMSRNPLRNEFVLLPMNLDDNHWVLCAIAHCQSHLTLAGDPDGAEGPLSIFILDSLLGSRPNRPTAEKQVIGLIKAMGADLGGMYTGDCLASMKITWPDAVARSTTR